MAEYRTTKEKEFQRFYNIRFNSDGTVFDINTKTCYNNLNEWSKSVIKLLNRSNSNE